jgi:hypothetical protein
VGNAQKTVYIYMVQRFIKLMMTISQIMPKVRVKLVVVLHCREFPF